MCTFPHITHNMTGWLSGTRTWYCPCLLRAHVLDRRHKSTSSCLMTACSHQSAPHLWRSIRWYSAGSTWAPDLHRKHTRSHFSAFQAPVKEDKYVRFWCGSHFSTAVTCVGPLSTTEQHSLARFSRWAGSSFFFVSCSSNYQQALSPGLLWNQ